MCGICGGWMPSNAAGFDDAQASTMLNAMLHRGPHDGGHWGSDDHQAMLGSRRLAIIDVSPAGHMPMWSEDGSVGIVFNGECYNYTELRAAQLARGHRFKSETDTECVINSYVDACREQGDIAGIERALLDLRGMYAFALWDRRRNRMLLV